MTDDPSVTVVVPVHDGARFLADALDSVRVQACPAVQSLVVDDGSRDDSAVIARELGARVIVSEHRGIAHARNLGVAAAEGELVAFLDADDVWTDDSLAPRISYLDARDDVDYVFGHMVDFVDPVDPPPPWLPRARVPERVGIMSTFVLRRDVLARTGPFDEALVIGEDIEWVARATDGGAHGACLDGVFARHRLHGASATARNAGLAREAIRRTVRDSVRRKRNKTS